MKAEKRAVLGIVLLVILFHANGLLNGIAWDDIYYIERNAVIRSLSSWAGHFALPDDSVQGQTIPLWRPIRDLSYTLDYQLWMLRSFGYHLTNLLLHALNCLLLYFLARRLTKSDLAGFAAGALFAVHPVLTEAVAWIKGRDDLLATAFFLGGLLCYLDIQDRPAGRTWTKISFLALLVLGLLSKEAALCLVPAAALTGWWRLHMSGCSGTNRPETSEPVISQKGFFAAGLALTLLYLFCRTVVLGRFGQVDTVPGSLGNVYPTMVHVMAFYLNLAVFPVNLVCDYSHFPVHASFLDPAVLLSLLGFVLLGILLYRFRYRAPWLVLGIALFYLNLLPVSNLVPTMQWLAERFLYLPMTGFCLAAGSVVELAALRLGVHSDRARKMFLYGVFPGILMLLGIGTGIRNLDWCNTRTIMESAVRVAPHNMRVLGILGVVELNDGNYRKVAELFDGAFWKTTDPEILRNYGYALINLGKREEGIMFIRVAMAAKPDWYKPYEDLGEDAVSRREFREAADWFTRSVKLAPLNARCWNNLAMALSDAGDPASALQAAERARELDRTNVNILRTLVNLAWRLERWQLCEKYLLRLQELQPGDQQAGEWLQKVRSRTDKPSSR